MLFTALLTEFSVPSETRLIGAHALENCESLAELVLCGDPDIGDYAFANCSSIRIVAESLGR